jgi:hypothetical protein
MVEINISVDNDVLQQFQAALARSGSGGFPSVSAALEDSAKGVRKIWQGFAGGGSLPGIESLKRPGGGYAKSIKTRNYGPFIHEVYSDAKVAEWIENGTEELDMKTTHPFGPRSRLAKKKIKGSPKGYPQYRLVPYLIVPFRWGTPGTERDPRVGFRNIIPQAIYGMIGNKENFLRSTTRKTTHTEENFHHKDVERDEYDWGDRVLKEDVFSLTDGNKEDYHTVGMVAMDTGISEKQETNYFTFRVISADSPQGSWIKPAMKPRPVTQTVANLARNGINDAVEAAIMGDLANL